MPTKPIERLMFAQGGQCFFCRKPLQKAEASVEHLVALTHGGNDNDENCVACCTALNSLFGRMSLKEKLQVVLNQKGEFKCPAASVGTPPTPKPAPAKAAAKTPGTRAEAIALVVADLRKRGVAKPATVGTLLSTIKSCLTHSGENGNGAEAMLQELCDRAYVTVSGKKVTYSLPPTGI